MDYHQPSRKPHKRRRKQLSCDNCRQLKVKCDRVEPLCSKCKERGLTAEQCSRTLVETSHEAFQEYGQGKVRQKDLPTPPSSHSPSSDLANQAAKGPSLWSSAANESPYSINSVDSQQQRLSHVDLPTPTPSQISQQPSVSSSHESTAIERARMFLPRKRQQMEAVLDVYMSQISICKPFFGHGKLVEQITWLYNHYDEQESKTYSYALVSLLCALTSAVYDVMPPTRLVIWRVISEAHEAGTLSSQLSSSSVECFHLAQRHHEEEARGHGVNRSHLTSLLLQAGLANVYSPSARLPSVPCVAMLDTCVRIARRHGLDRMGATSRQSDKSMEALTKFALWSALVSADWKGAPYHGSYSVYPGTFDTEWDLTLDQVQTPEFAQEDLEDLQRMCVWPWTVRSSAVSRQMCDLGVHSASQRQTLSYDDVIYHDKYIQSQLDSRPDEWKIEVKHEELSEAARQRLHDYPWLKRQGCQISHALRSALLSLHMPYLLQGYAKDEYGGASDKFFSVRRALEQASMVVHAAQRIKSKGGLFHQSLLARHTLFKAGLVLMLDLLLLPCPFASTNKAHRSAFGQGGPDEQLSFVIDCLDQSNNYESQLIASSIGAGVEDHHSPYGLNLSGSRLLKLYTHAVQRSKFSNGGNPYEGQKAVQEYMQVHAPGMMGYPDKGGKGTTLVNIPTNSSSVSSSGKQLSSSSTATDISAAPFLTPLGVERPQMTSEELLESMLVFAGPSAGLPLEAILSDPFLQL